MTVVYKKNKQSDTSIQLGEILNKYSNLVKNYNNKFFKTFLLKDIFKLK